ncbi:MAG: HPr family phosphocarrier protein, partial [Bauldia sp.]
MQTEQSAPSYSSDLAIVNKKGLHARAAAKFVQCAERHDATV